MKSIVLPIIIGCFAFPLGAQDVELEKISSHVWVHTSYAKVGGVRVGSNGIVIDTPDGLVLVDTCWNDAQTRALLGLVERDLKKTVTLAIVTHAHEDRIGGIRALLAKKIRVVSTPLTAQRAATAGYPEPVPRLNPVRHLFQHDDQLVE